MTRRDTPPLVDTNVISELTRPRPDAGVLSWAAENRRIGLSVVTVEEIVYGLARKPIPRIRAFFDELIRERCEVLPITEAIARECGRLRGRLAGAGVVRTQADMLIGATALVHRRTLVSRNVRDFEGCGIALLDPFTGSSR